MTKPHMFYPNAAEMSELARLATLRQNITRITEATEVAPTGSYTYHITGTTALALTIDTANLKAGDVIRVISAGETSSGNHTVVPKVAGKIKQLDGSTAAASTIMADLNDWAEYYCRADGTLEVVLHNGCTFS
jgi:hypothetical protein